MSITVLSCVLKGQSPTNIQTPTEAALRRGAPPGFGTARGQRKMDPWRGGADVAGCGLPLWVWMFLDAGVQTSWCLGVLVWGFRVLGFSCPKVRVASQHSRETQESMGLM